MATGSGNLDDEVQIGINGNVNVDGVKKAGTDIDQLTAKIGKLDTALGNVNKTAELLSSILSEINKKTSIKIDNISGNQIKIQSGRSSVRYDPNNPNAVKSAQASQERIDRLLSQEERIYAEKVRKAQIENDNYDKLIELQEKEIRARQTFSDARMESARFKNSKENLRNLDANSAQREALLGYYKYKGEHPELFAPQRGRFSYQMGNGLIDIGRNISSYGIGGMLAGGAIQSVGAYLKSPAMGAATAITQLTKSISTLAKETISAYSEIEAIKTNLSVVYSSDVQADSAFSQLSQYAVKSPFGVQQTSELAILLKQSGVYASDLMDTLKMLGDTAGGNMEKMKRIANNYAQIVSIGKASMLDMRQFAYAGIPIFEAVSKELGVSQQNLRKLISDGKVTSDIIEKVFKDLTGINGIFENATQKGAETLKARLQNLKDAKQLMMAEFGEGIVNIGKTGSNDGYVRNSISWIEDLYTRLQSWQAINNIENDVKAIAEQDGEIKRLEDLIEYNEAVGNKQEAKRLQKQLDEYIKSRYDPEKERATLANAYDERIQRGKTLEDVLLNERDADLFNARANQVLNASAAVIGTLESLGLKTLAGATGVTNWALGRGYQTGYLGNLAEQQDQNVKDFWKTFWTYADVKRYAKNGYGATDEMNQANAERYTENEQVVMGDFIKSARDDKNSVTKISQDIIAAYENTETYKEEQQKQTLKKWEDTQKLLQEISDHTDENSDLNFDNLTTSQFFKYLNAGALEETRLAITGDRPSLLADSRKDLEESILWAVRRMNEELPRFEIMNGFYPDFLGSRLADFVDLQSIKDNKEFVNQFNKTFQDFGSTLDTLKDDSKTQEEQKLYGDMKKLLQSMLYKYSVDLTALGIDLSTLNQEKDKVQDTFVPLWKRILSSATGVSTKAITGTRDTLDFFSENLSTRKNVGSTLSALVRNGLPVDVIQSLTSNRIGKTADGTWQIDWKSTRDVVGDFAKSISASTTAIDMWTKGLEDEYNTYADLIGNGILSPETDNVNQARYISAKKVEQSWLSEGEQGVNAFGEKLINGLGEEVVKIVDGVAYGKNSKGEFYQLQDQNLKITGTIYEEIKKRLPEIEKELRETRLIQAKNQVLNKMTSDTFGGVITGRGMSRRNEITEFWTKFNEQAMTILRSQISSEKLQEYGFGTYEDAQAAYLRKDSDALVLFNLALEDTNRIISAFVNSPEYAELKKVYNNKDHQSDVNSAYSVFNGFVSNRTPFAGYGTSTNPYEQNGIAGFRHRLFGGSVMEGIGLNGASIRDLSVMAKQMKLSEELLAMNDKEADAWVAKQIAIEAVNKSLKDMSNSLMDIAKNTSKQMFLSPFETIGENLVGYVKNGEKFTDYLKDAGQAMRGIAGQMISNMGAEMATAGFRIAAAAAMSNQWGKVAAGLALAGAGGFASGFGNYLQSAKEDSDDDKVAKLESLEEKLADLLQQARTDALYYENNLRHKTALGHNEKFNYQSVNDAVIAPGGKVISTSPEDYLIATKTPQTLGSAAPIINNKIINNAGVKVRQEQSVNPDGSIDITTYLENAMDNYITSGRGDEAFEIMNMRKAGRRGIM